MRVDPSQSEYHEDPNARGEFTRQELKYCRQLLRRLRFLEKQARDRGGDEAISNDPSGSTMFTAWEISSLEWALTELGFLAEHDGRERVTP